MNSPAILVTLVLLVAGTSGAVPRPAPHCTSTTSLTPPLVPPLRKVMVVTPDTSASKR